MIEIVFRAPIPLPAFSDVDMVCSSDARIGNIFRSSQHLWKFAFIMSVKPLSDNACSRHSHRFSSDLAVPHIRVR